MKAVRHTLETLLLTLLIALSPLPASAKDYRLEVVADKLRWPWSVAKLPDGGFLISEREGRLLHQSGSGERKVLSGTPDTFFAGQGGYFDVVLHPRFTETRLIYLSYASGKQEANATAVFRARFENGQLLDGEEILRVTPDKNTPQHYGGRLLFLGDGTLLVTTGEGYEQREQAQALNSELGKVLRVQDSGQPAGLRPSSKGDSKRIWTYGHRNPQGITRDSYGTVYLHEHGPRGGDELNIIYGGNNYGWPLTTHGVDYSGAYVTPFRHAPKVIDPVWIWVPSIAPSGMAWYAGGDFPEWTDSLLIGALVSKDVRRLEMRDQKVVHEESLFGELDTRMRDVRVFDGEIFLLTDGEQGQLLRVRPSR
jgi:glucose/arabinose dehydrogenase